MPAPILHTGRRPTIRYSAEKRVAKAVEEQRNGEDEIKNKVRDGQRESDHEIGELVLHPPGLRVAAHGVIESFRDHLGCEAEGREYVKGHEEHR